MGIRHTTQAVHVPKLYIGIQGLMQSEINAADCYQSIFIKKTLRRRKKQEQSKKDDD